MEVPESDRALIMSEHLKVVGDYGFYGITKSIVNNNFQIIQCYQSPAAFRYLQRVMNEMRKNQNFHFDLQIHPTLINSTYLNCQMTVFILIREGSKIFNSITISKVKGQKESKIIFLSAISNKKFTSFTSVHLNFSKLWLKGGYLSTYL